MNWGARFLPWRALFGITFFSFLERLAQCKYKIMTGLNLDSLVEHLFVAAMCSLVSAAVMRIAMRSVADFSGLAMQTVRELWCLATQSVTSGFLQTVRALVRLVPMCGRFLAIAIGVLLLLALWLVVSVSLARRVRDWCAIQLVHYARPRLRVLVDAAVQDPEYTRLFVERMEAIMPPRSGADFSTTRKPLVYVRRLSHPEALAVVTYAMFHDTIVMEAVFYAHIYMLRLRALLLLRLGWWAEAKATMTEGGILCRALHELRRVQIAASTIT
jgi:hypothetical protein